MYSLEIKNKAFKQLNKKIPRPISFQVMHKLKVLRQDPFSTQLNIKKLSSFKNLSKAYRLRIREIRVIYELDTKAKKITIYSVDYRRTTTYS